MHRRRAVLHGRKAVCTVGEQFCTSGKLFCPVGKEFCLSEKKRLLFRQPQTCGTFAVAVVQEQRRHSCKPRGQPCWHLLGPEGHGGRLRLLLLCLLVLSCNGHFLRRGSVSLGHVETRSTRATPCGDVSQVFTSCGSIPHGGRICGTGTECCLRDEFASDSWLYRGYWCNASSQLQGPACSACPVSAGYCRGGRAGRRRSFESIFGFGRCLLSGQGSRLQGPLAF